MRRIVRGGLLVVVIACLVAFFSFGNEGEGAGNRQVSRMFVGQPWPWFESRMEQEVKPNGGFASSSDAGVILTSPAWLLLGSAAAGILAFRRLRPAAPEVAAA